MGHEDDLEKLKLSVDQMLLLTLFDQSLYCLLVWVFILIVSKTLHYLKTMVYKRNENLILCIGHNLISNIHDLLN